MEHTLVLNASYEPLDVVEWTRAMVLWSQGKVEIVETHDREARSVQFSFRVPSIVRLRRYVKTSRRDYVPLTRTNVYLRDRHICQYCKVRGNADTLTVDHIFPVARGGPRTWENLVTCCVSCNRRKGCRTPEEAGMILVSVPSSPTPSMWYHARLGARRLPSTWRTFLAPAVPMDGIGANMLYSCE